MSLDGLHQYRMLAAPLLDRRVLIRDACNDDIALCAILQPGPYCIVQHWQLKCEPESVSYSARDKSIR